MRNSLFVLLILGSLFSSCKDKVLPVIGHGDHRVADFKFVNQDGQEVTNSTFDGKVYIADFFFIHCPSICPKVKKQMLRIYDKFEADPRVVLLSHTLDPDRDTIEALKVYASNLEVKTDKWHFVTGDEEDLHGMTDDYFSVGYRDPDAPGGFDHSGKLLLVDDKRQIRSFCEGTEAESVTDFMKDISILLNEY